VAHQYGLASYHYVIYDNDNNAGPDDTTIDGYRLACTCFACPEQYFVFDGDDQVGYLRLRHGRFTAEAPDCGDELVYVSYTNGDGMFTDAERMPELRRAVAAIKKFTKGKGKNAAKTTD
jgi:hypothetical protein